MPSGIIVIDKPADWTSHDVVAKLRGILRERRIGHAGTLDPMATGVLPVFVGRATRAVEFATEGEKEYIAGLRLGLVTDTQDITGSTLSEQPVTQSLNDLLAVLPAFRGDIKQIPPMFSAIKQQGKKLYELARAGKEVARAPRPVCIHNLEVVKQVSTREYILRVRCSKGTYIRTLCHDIGQSLGCGATLYSLRRSMAAGFLEVQAVSLKTLMDSKDPTSLLLPVDAYFSVHPALCVSAEQEAKIRNGQSFPFEQEKGIYRVYSAATGAFLMLGRCEEHMLLTVKSFYEV